MATLERIETERGVDSTEAGTTLDRELKRRRKAAAWRGGANRWRRPAPGPVY